MQSLLYIPVDLLTKFIPTGKSDLFPEHFNEFKLKISAGIEQVGFDHDSLIIQTESRPYADISHGGVLFPVNDGIHRIDSVGKLQLLRWDLYIQCGKSQPSPSRCAVNHTA